MPAGISPAPTIIAAVYLFDCADDCLVLLNDQNWDSVMIETFAALCVFISTAIFLAHAFDSYRSRT